MSGGFFVVFFLRHGVMVCESVRAQISMFGRGLIRSYVLLGVLPSARSSDGLDVRAFLPFLWCMQQGYRGITVMIRPLLTQSYQLTLSILAHTHTHAYDSNHPIRSHSYGTHRSGPAR